MSQLQRRTDRSRIQSVGRAISVLEALSEEQHGLGIVELSERVTLPVSSVHRLLATLSDGGFVSQNLTTGRYRIGFRAFEVGNAFLQQSQLREIAQPHIQELSKLTSLTANLALRDGTFASYVYQVQSERSFQIGTDPGTRLPLYCSGAGKVFLAGMPKSEFESVISKIELVPWTKYTVTTVPTLRKHIMAVQRQGYALDDEEMQIGMRCLATPVYDYRRKVAAGISVVGPLSNMNDEKLPELISRVRRIASVISGQLGYIAAEQDSKDK